jgi:uncharacterized protein YbjT (DUF2867 family)
MILVTGATGNAGSQVVRALVERGEHVRAFVRDRERAQRILGEDVQLAVGDLADPESVRSALEGIDQLVLSCADDPRRVGWETSAIDAAETAGVRRIVRLSTIGSEAGAAAAFWDWHGRVDAHLRRSVVAGVVLQSRPYMSNVLAAAAGVAAEGKLYAPAAGARIAMIDPRDVGAAAAAVLSTPPRDDATYVLTGPEAITYADVAAALSSATGREVAFVDVPDEQGRDAMIEAGVPEAVAGQIVRVFALLRRGAAERVTTTVESLTGRPPRDFASFARDHAALFTPDAVGAASA